MKIIIFNYPNMLKTITKDLSEKIKLKKFKLKDILTELFASEELKTLFPGEIRRNSIIGDIANKLSKKFKLKETCKVMAIGDIKYFKKTEKKWHKLVKKSLKKIDTENLVGYDLESIGSKDFRESITNYMGNYYDFGNINQKQISDSILPSYGATDGFSSILDSLNKVYENINFISPEASFVSNIALANNILGEKKVKKINKYSRQNFFFGEAQIDKLYENELSVKNTNVYYITPVGNPTGEKISKTSFEKIIRKINRVDPNAIFIMDNVYLGLLEEQVAKDMFSFIFKSEKILDKIIFTESLSKTLGLTGIRVAWSWTFNEKLYYTIRQNIALKKAGFSKMLNEFSVNLLKENKKIIKFQNEAFNFWNTQRKKFYEDMVKNHSDLFDFQASCGHTNREGIYLLLKVKSGLTKQ